MLLLSLAVLFRRPADDLKSLLGDGFEDFVFIFCLDLKLPIEFSVDLVKLPVEILFGLSKLTIRLCVEFVAVGADRICSNVSDWNSGVQVAHLGSGHSMCLHSYSAAFWR